MNEFLIVIPAFNEVENLESVIKSLKQHTKLLDIVIIDDGSTDGTGNLARRLGVFVISHPTNLGYVSTVQTGFKYADKKNYPYVIFFDGDGQHDPANIMDIIRAIQLENVDVVIGSRYLQGSNLKTGFIKMLAVKFFRFIIFHITNKRITDPTSGFKAYKEKVYKRFINTRDFPYDLPDSNFIIDILLQNLTVLEIPVNMFERQHGKSKIHFTGLKPILYMAQTLLSILIVIIKNKLHVTGGKSS